MRGWASPNLRSAPPHPGCGGGGDGGALAGRLGDGAPGLAGWPTRRGRPWSGRGEGVGENGVDGVCARRVMTSLVTSYLIRGPVEVSSASKQEAIASP